MAEFAGRPIEGWVELELLGHRVKYGHLTIESVAEDSPIFFRLEEPAVPKRGAVTSFYSPQAIYGIHPTTEVAVVDELTPMCHERIEVEHGHTLCDLKAGHEGDCDDGLQDLPF